MIRIKKNCNHNLKVFCARLNNILMLTSTEKYTNFLIAFLAYLMEEIWSINFGIKSIYSYPSIHTQQYWIVSNSSFSWWGAYMMKNRKRVIFPKYWHGWKVKIESHPGIQPSWGSVIEFDRILKWKSQLQVMVM